MAEAPVTLVQRMYECFGKGDMETIRNEIFAPDLVWHLPGRHPLSGTKNGVEEVLAFFGQLVKTGVQIDEIKIDLFGEDTAVETHRGYGESNGAVLNGRNCTHYKVRDGKIAEVQVYTSDQYSLDNYFWAAYALKPIPDRLAG